MSNAIADSEVISYERPGRTSRFYYGWICVGVAALAMVATLPGRTMGLGLITEAVLRDLNLSRTTFGNINLVATLIGAAFGLGCGRLIDRVGSRLVLTGVTAALGIVVLAMSRASGPWSLLATVTLTRGLGQSALSTASIALVGKWFDRKVDRAMAVYAVLLTIGFMIAIPGFDHIARELDWRTTWAGLGIVLIAAVTPIFWLLARSSPEASGLLIDGRRTDEDAGSNGDGHTLSAALSTSAFWAFAIGGLIFNTAYSGITLFNESILAERGFEGSATGPLIVIVFTGLAANFGAGWVARSWPINRVMAIAMGLLAMALALLPVVRSAGQVMAYAVLMGVAGGVVTVVFFSCWSRMFGRAHLGKIQGRGAQTVTVLASAAGPALFAYSREWKQSYTPALLLLAPVAAASAAWCWFVRMPSR